ncbi:hypothetical protein HDV03_001573 [Kappamyces sp. JEL0829]|nr:hypothetical protein HDV03_001573 [Kappamyces sp. JEL0829]
MTIDVKSNDDEISLQVFDDQKRHFLGGTTIRMGDLVAECGRTYDGSIQKVYSLEARESRGKDKYVGGKIQITARVEEKKTSSSKSYQEIQATMSRMQVDNRALFDILLRACLVLDLFSPREGRAEVLSPEAINMLKAWARTWSISEPYQVMAYLKILFEKYTADLISIADLIKAFHFLYATVKNSGTFNAAELKLTIDLLEKMKEHCGNRVTKYKELFPKNQPRGALESTILVLRMIHRFPTFRDKHPELQESFRDELRIMMTEACISRFQRFKEHASPLDEGDVESVIEGINKLADSVNQEIEEDVQYYQPAFAQELDIVRLTAENQLKYFTLVLEDGGDVLGGDSAVANASHHVFSLYKTLRMMAERYAKSVGGLTAMSTAYVESWFAPFMYKWLHELSKKTLGWVEQAVKADSFVPEGVSADGVVPLHSSSITDVFSAIYSELEFITDLKWSDPVQNAQFFQAFAKTVNIAIEQYCDAIALIEKKAATAVTVSDFTKNLLGGRGSEPKDIEAESCAKLRNIAFAMSKLREMYKMMNVTAITRNVKNHRKSMAVTKPPPVTQDFVTGAFKIHVSYAENLKPTLKNGSSNPYLIVRVPEGTVVPPPEDVPRKKTMSPTTEQEPEAPPQPTILSGNACELFRSRAINETLNPTWEETHAIILPPVERLDVAVFSKNLITADEVDGTAIIDLSVGTRLRRKLMDHQTHDIYVELEPQGRVLLRLTMEGEEEDVDFWFRRTNERLIRTRDSFLRSLTAKITPYISQILGKALKDNEAAPLPSTSYFSSLISAVQYSDKTAAGIPIDRRVDESDSVLALTPLIEYLEKNLETLCSQLPSLMAQAIIERIWGDVLTISTNLLVPPLFGLHSQKKLNIRQSSMVFTCLGILRDFMHGDGGEFGLPFETLDTAAYYDLMELLKLYHVEVTKLRREYELSLLGGKDKELLLRLVRLIAEKDSPDAQWIENQLIKRRDQTSRR